MKWTKNDKKAEAESLRKFGMTEEEIEGYFEFFDNASEAEAEAPRRVRLLRMMPFKREILNNIPWRIKNDEPQN